MVRLLSCLLLAGFSACVSAQDVPSVYTHVKKGDDGRVYLQTETDRCYQVTEPADFRLEDFRRATTGTADGLSFDFGPTFKGKMYYGFIPSGQDPGDSRHPQPVYFKSVVLIKEGKTSFNIREAMSERYDMVGWQKKGYGTIGYRVVTNYGKFVYDGRVSFEDKIDRFEVVPDIEEGPFITCVTPTSVKISFTTTAPVKATVKLLGPDQSAEGENFEFTFDNLPADAEFGYRVTIGKFERNYRLKTAPAPGTRKPFTFAYASDARAGQGGGERSIHGANAYIMKRIMALSLYRNVAFAQFSGDLVNGYLHDQQEMDLQYANWKRSIEPYACYVPVYVSFGNHESFGHIFRNEEGTAGYILDGFPFEEASGERRFADNFVMPENGPESEDGQAYDPNPDAIDFPSYRENVYSYQHDNVAVIVLNSNYLFTPGRGAVTRFGGGLHAYIMDGQMNWFSEQLEAFENDENIDHVFVTLHTPFFPNGGHVGDDMWYGGDNTWRPVIAGVPMEEGIIERRDQLLDLAVNQTTKVRGILTGDEHNYCRTEVGPETPMYPADWSLPKLKLKRTIWQINNGAAGAPYYAQERTPWTSFTKGFTTQNALVLVHVDGKEVKVEVQNPDTLEDIDRFFLNR